MGVWLRIGGRIGLEPASRAGATRGWRGTHRDLGGIGHGGAGEVPFGSLRLDRDTRGQRRREEVEVGARIFTRGADSAGGRRSMCDAPGLAARVSPPRSNGDDGTIERRRGPRGRDESHVDDAAVEMGPRSRTRPHVAASHAAPPRRSLPKALVNLQRERMNLRGLSGWALTLAPVRARGALRLEAALMGAAAMADMAADILRRTTTSGLGARLSGQWTGRGGACIKIKGGNGPQIFWI